MQYKNEKCIVCKYRDWDCKNCYADNPESQLGADKYKPNVMFDLIMTRKCNFRCTYCGITFSDNVLREESINRFISLLEQNRNNLGEIRIEFFGGEPLLEIENIRYIVENTYKLGIKYIIVTNGKLFDDKTIKFFQKYNFDVIFSVSLFNSKFLDSQRDIFVINKVSDYIVNFIIEPNHELEMYGVFKTLLALGFRKFNMLPAHYTIQWSKVNLENLDLLLSKIGILYEGLRKKGINSSVYYGRSGDDFDKDISKDDIEFVLDCDGKIYGDYEAELYILNDIVPDEVFSIKDIYIDDINSSKFNILEIFRKRKDIKPYIFLDKITNYLNINDNLTSLGDIMSKNNINIKA